MHLHRLNRFPDSRGRRLLPAVSELAASLPDAPTEIAAISSVVKEAGAISVQQLTIAGFSVRQLPRPVRFPRPRLRLPHTLGADRIANALFGIRRFPAGAYHHRTGTAVTIDYVADRTFRGGAILPGIALQLESLHMPQMDFQLWKASIGPLFPPFPAARRKTASSGGAPWNGRWNQRIVARYRDYAAPGIPSSLRPRRLAFACKLVKFRNISVPDLTLIGTACLLDPTINNVAPHRGEDVFHAARSPMSGLPGRCCHQSRAMTSIHPVFPAAITPAVRG